MSTGLLDVVKRAALEAVENHKPADLRYGTVTSVKPLKIKVTNLFTIPEAMLVVPEHLTDHEIKVSVKSDYGWHTQNRSGGSGDSSFASHNHGITVDKLKFFVHNALKVGDKVALMRQAGGQTFLVLDRLVDD